MAQKLFQEEKEEKETMLHLECNFCSVALVHGLSSHLRRLLVSLQAVLQPLVFTIYKRVKSECCPSKQHIDLS